MKVLLIGAHQGDMELRCADMVHKYLKLGHEVRFLCVSDGSAGHHILPPKKLKKVRAMEAQKVAKRLGIRYDIWDIADGHIMPDLKTRERVIRYIREYNPDLIFTHRANDYHPDHRAVAQLVQDASYMLIVPNICPDAPSMRFMPVIMFYENPFKIPEFVADVVVDIDDEIELKLECADYHRSQMYEWLPYTYGEEGPKTREEELEWLRGINITQDTTDEEINAMTRGYAVAFAKVAARFRKELIEKYGEERGKKVRYAEALMLSEYGTPLTEETKKTLFPF